MVSDRGQRNSSRQRDRCSRVSTIWLCSTLILRKNIFWKSSRVSHQPQKRTCGSTAVTSCHKGTIHLLTSMPSPGFKPRTYGVATSVTNHYTGCVNVTHVRREIPSTDLACETELYERGK
ncbi:hypothetical protein TNCV_3680101 [Trichonephila clavipes]|nr:hypothetical protein TNCV_3680101 [Trichonephila clavipes]